MRLPTIHIRWLGYRGCALMMFGLIWVFLGVAVLANNDANPVLFHTHFPIWFRFSIWAGAGVLAIIAAITHDQWEWTGHIGFGALFIGPGERALSYGWAMVSEPNIRWLAATSVYLLLSGVILLLASWPEPPEDMTP